LVLILLFYCFHGYAYANDFYIATGWLSTNLDYDNCIKEARKTLTEMDYMNNQKYESKPGADGSGTASGSKNMSEGYSYSICRATIRCISTKHVVIFAIACSIEATLIRTELRKIKEEFKYRSTR
jgi:hypothetical protein